MDDSHDNTSQELYNLLESKKDKLKGKLNMILGGVPVTIQNSDSIGNVIEEWLKKWAVKNNITLTRPGASQVFPDYLIGKDDAYLEVKAWNFKSSPAFDIANFDSYCNTLVTCPQKIYSDYLIFGYSLTKGKLKIEKIYLKKVWEITRKMGKNGFPLNVQQKNNQIYNIRPSAFHSERKTALPSFKNKDEFVKALYDTKDVDTGTKEGTKQLKKFEEALKEYDSKNP